MAFRMVDSALHTIKTYTYPYRVYNIQHIEGNTYLTFGDNHPQAGYSWRIHTLNNDGTVSEDRILKNVGVLPVGNTIGGACFDGKYFYSVDSYTGLGPYTRIYQYDENWNIAQVIPVASIYYQLIGLVFDGNSFWCLQQRISSIPQEARILNISRSGKIMNRISAGASGTNPARDITTDGKHFIVTYRNASAGRIPVRTYDKKGNCVNVNGFVTTGDGGGIAWNGKNLILGS